MAMLLNIAVALLVSVSLPANYAADVSKVKDVSFSKISPSDSSLWIAATGRGLVRVGRNGRAFSYSSAKGDFPCDSIVALDFDADGVLWFIDSRGDSYSYSSYRGFVREAAPEEISGSLAAALSGQSGAEDETGSQEAGEGAGIKERAGSSFSWWKAVLILLGLGLCFIIGRRTSGRRTSGRLPVAGPEPAIDPSAGPAPAPTRQPAAQAAEQSAPKSGLQPAPEPAPQPVAESGIQQGSELAPEPASQPASSNEQEADVSKSNVIKADAQSFYNEVVELVNSGFTDPDFSVETIAAHFGISRVHLNRKLKAAEKQSPSELIKSARMNLASELLRSGEYTVLEVARKSGFSSAAYFSAAFKDYFNLSPSSLLPISSLSTGDPEAR